MVRTTGNGAEVVRIGDAELEKARRALRHASHVHHTSTDDGKAAAELALEHAALAFVLAKIKATVSL